MAQCEHITKAGARCRARAVSGTSACFLHADPENARNAGRNGGLRRTLLAAANLERLERPESALAVARALAQILCEVRTGAIAPKTGSVLAALGMAAIKGFEAGGDGLLKF